ncbi:MAG: type II secretion system F family protein [Lachnospiraceae bacterium]|nr:type II secretion system F family protein [Lachnospiraceae bacterium]
MRDYRKIFWTRERFGTLFLQAVLVTVLLAWFFYRSIWALLPLSAAGALYFRKGARELIRKDREDLERQFRECIESVKTALKAGYSAENAFLESEKDLELLFGRDSMIYREMELIRRGLVVNRTLEELLAGFAIRSGSDAIGQFAEVFVIAKRSGGNLPEVIRDASELIGEQMEAKAELRTLLSGRRMEQNIMKLMPFGILLYIGLTSPGYFDSLYGNPKGVLLMTGLLGVYLAAFFLGEHILGKLEEECA